MAVVRRNGTSGLSACDRAAQRLTDDGLTDPPQPAYEIPQVPADITELDERDLMNLLNQLEAWAGYAAVRAAAAAAHEREAIDASSLEEAKALIAVWGQSEGKVTLARAQREVQPDVVDQKQRQVEAYAYRKVAETQASSLERRAAAVSRELTRRTSPERRNRFAG